MIVVKDALPKQVAEELLNQFMTATYRHHSQVKDGFYPDRPGESYMCRFHRAHEMDKNKVFNQAVKMVGAILGEQRLVRGEGFIEFFAYKMTDGDFFREHDDKGNGLGFILYLSRKWQWDWGGLLMVQSEDGYRAFKPTFNQLVVIAPRGTKHFVTPVADYAKEPRYAMVGFIK